jgi:hypothetical protein
MTRLARAFTITLLAALVAVTVGVQPADAARGYCRVDPVIMVDGQLADVFVTSTIEMLTSATGPISMEIVIPVGSRGSVWLTDVGFLRGYNIVFKQSSALKRTATHTQVRVRVYAPAKNSSLPVTVTFAPRTLSSSLREVLFGSSASGYANAWVTLTTS